MGLGGSLGGATLSGALSGFGVHRYDTGLYRPQRTVLRQAVIDMLAPLLLANGQYIRSIKALPRPLRDHSPEELGFIGNAVQGQAPCLLVALGRKDYSATGMDGPSVHYHGEIELAIYVVSTNARSYVEGRLTTDAAGDTATTADPGIEAMLEHVEELLIGQDPDIESIYEFRPKDEDEVFTGGEETAWEQRYTVRVEREINPARHAGLITSLEARNNLDAADLANPIVDTITQMEVP